MDHMMDSKNMSSITVEQEMTSDAAWPTSEGYSHSHVWVCSSFMTPSDRRSLQCFIVRKTKVHVRTNQMKKSWTTSVRGRTASAVDPSGLHVCRYKLLWWLQIYGHALLIAPKGADGGKRGEWGLPHRVWHNLYPSRIRTCFFMFTVGRIRPPKQWIFGR